MTRTFLHSFEPAIASPITGATVDLNVADIKDAGLREVMQTPGAAYGVWSILDALLTPTGAGMPFIFKQPSATPNWPARSTVSPNSHYPVRGAKQRKTQSYRRRTGG